MRSLKIAIVGSGPSGFYAAEELLQHTLPIEITMLERLPVPFGLVRSGVAPDHPKLKLPALTYDKIAQSARFHYLGNVELGRDLSVTEILECHHAIIFACGAFSARKLEIPGETLTGVHSASEFVGWYNGHPDYRHLCFDLSQERVAVIGQGNVALDLARILAKPASDLRCTDIADHAAEALSKSRVREIHIFGRRGPTQAKFTAQELAEFADIRDCKSIVSPRDLELNLASQQEAADRKSRDINKNLGTLRGFTDTCLQGWSGRICQFHFYRRPTKIFGTNRVEGIQLSVTSMQGEPFEQTVHDTGEVVDFSCGLVFSAIGFGARPIEGIPFDFRKGVLPNTQGRLIGENKEPLYGLYATGWIKRGASGTIGSNRADSLGTVSTLLSDLDRLDKEEKTGWHSLASLLASRQREVVTYKQWIRIDQAEIYAGQLKNKPREKFTDIDDMLTIAKTDSAACDRVAFPEPQPLRR